MASASPRKRFFSGESSHELPLATNSSPLHHHSFGGYSTSNLRLMPGRSLSSNAALVYNNTHHSHSTGDLDGFRKTPYGFEPKPRPPPLSHYCVQGVSVLSFILLCVLGIAMREHNLELQHTIQMRDHEIEHHIGHSEALETKVNKLKSATFQLTQHVEALEQRPATGSTELQRKLFHMEHYQMQIHQGIQTSSRRMVQEK